MPTIRRKPRETVCLSRKDLVSILGWLEDIAKGCATSPERAQRNKAFEIRRMIGKIKLCNDIKNG